MKSHLLFLLVLILFSSGCKNQKKEHTKTEEITSSMPKIDVSMLETNQMEWWTYHKTNIIFSSTFVAVNSDFKIIEKEEFFEQLLTGEFIPIKISNETEQNRYQLHKLSSNANETISRMLKSDVQLSFNNYLMEGTSFPNFGFSDLKGKNHTNSTIKGKKVILKTWFINCKPCIAEMPELNEFVLANQNENYSFLSLATDSKEELEHFLQKRDFEYAVVPNQKAFIQDSLKLGTYPTHIVIDEEGTIKKVVTKASELIAFLNLEKSSKEMEMPPPPPPSMD